MTIEVRLFRSLNNATFAQLYAGQTISLLGDALTWVGLALTAFELAGTKAAAVLSIALTLRVTAFVLISPLAGSLADRFDRKQILTLTHLARTLVVAMLPFVAAIWQLYALILLLNCLNALFTPTYKATLPLVTGKEDYRGAIALSSATGQLLGMLGPGIAGGIAAFMGAKQLFFLDALSFLLAAIAIATLPGQINDSSASWQAVSMSNIWEDIKAGTTQMLSKPQIRYALGMQLVAAIAGAQILVNTVGYVEGTLNLSSVYYGWVMAAFGTGATLAAVVVGTIDRSDSLLSWIGCGAVLITLAILPANYVTFFPLMGLWLLAGMGESWINVPTQTAIADLIPSDWQGRVYGAHFAWSHLWWVFAYPLAGWLGDDFDSVLHSNWLHSHTFLSGSLISLAILLVVQLSLFPKSN